MKGKDFVKLRKIIDSMHENSYKEPNAYLEYNDFIIQIISKKDFLLHLCGCRSEEYKKIYFFKYILTNIDSKYIEEMLNKIDKKSGYSILHSFVYHMIHNPISCCFLYRFLELILEYGDQHPDYDIDSLIKHKDDFNKTFIKTLIINSFNKTFYANYIFNIVELLLPKYKELIDDVYNDIIRIGNPLHRENSPSMMWLAVNHYEQSINENLIPKLWNLNIDLNIRNENDNTFLDYAIKNKVDPSAFINLLEESIKHGYDVNERPTIMKSVITNRYSSSIYQRDILKCLCDNGYDVYNSDIGGTEPVKMLYNEMSLINEFVKNYIVSGLHHELKNYNLVLEEDFNNKLSNIYYNFDFMVENLKKIFSIENDSEFLDILIKAIVEYHSNGVNDDHIITVTDVLESLKIIFINEQNRFFNQIDNCKIKCLKQNNT